MRELLVLSLVLLVTANTVNSGAIYRQYRQLNLPVEATESEALPAESYVSELRKDQIPVQVVEVIEPVLVVKPVENLRSIEPQIAIAEAEPAAVITNEIIPENAEKLDQKLEIVSAIEQEVEQAEKLALPQPIVEAVADAIVQQEEQRLRNIEPELPAAAPAIVLAVEVPEKKLLTQKLEELPIVEAAEKKLLPESLPEVVPEILAKEPLALAIIEEKKAEEVKPIEAKPLPEVKDIKEDLPGADILPEVPAIKEIELPALIETEKEIKSLEENIAQVQPEVKALKDEKPLIIETPKKEEIREEIKEELMEKKKEERREEKKDDPEEKNKEVLKEAIQTAIKEEIKEKLEEKIEMAIAEAPKAPAEEILPSAKQADNADPGATTARPPQQGFIQQLVQNTPLGQLFNNFNGNNQAASDDNSPVATATTFIQAIQNTTSQITNSIQQGLQQQLQSFQTTFSGQQAPQAAAASGDAAPAATTARPQGPLQSIVTSFLGNGGQQQQAAASQQQPAGPLQGILNLFGANRPNAGAAATPVAAAATAAAASTPAAAEALPTKDESEQAPSEAAASAEEASPEIARDSVETTADESQEEVKPDEIVVSDDGSQE